MTGTAVHREYQFGPFQLDARERRLSRGGEVIPLRLKVFDTLLVLVENAGRLLTKQELLDAVWPETTVEENNLNHNVSVLRKALGERATGQGTSRPCRASAIDSPPPSNPALHLHTPPHRRHRPPRRRVRRSVLHDWRRRPACLCDQRQRTAARESVELADTSGFRVGQSDLAALVCRAVGHHRVVRYDERGNGMSQRDVHE